jgi:hypothetical protein
MVWVAPCRCFSRMDTPIVWRSSIQETRTSELPRSTANGLSPQRHFDPIFAELKT